MFTLIYFIQTKRTAFTVLGLCLYIFKIKYIHVYIVYIVCYKNENVKKRRIFCTYTMLCTKHINKKCKSKLGML